MFRKSFLIILLIQWFMVCSLSVTVVLCPAKIGFADQSTTSAPATQVAESPPLGSPRDTIKTFLTTMQDKKPDQAIGCLDLSDIDEARRTNKGKELAQLLKELVDHRLPQIKLETIPDAPEYKNDNDQLEFALISNEETGKSEVILVRQDDGLWRFSKDTLAALPDLYKSIKKTPTTQPAIKAGVPKNLSTARETIRTFLEAMNDLEKHPERIDDAIKCLDLSKLPAPITSDEKELHLLAEQLFDICNRTKKIVYQEVPNDPQGEPYDIRAGKEGSVIVQRTEDGRWLFSGDTVLNIRTLYKELRETEAVKEGLKEVRSWELWLEARVPKSLHNEWLGLEYWQWIGLFLLIIVGVFIDHTLRFVLAGILNSILRHRRIEIQDRTKISAIRPLGLIIMGLIWWHGLRFLLLPLTISGILVAAAKIITAVAAIWAIYRLIDLVGDYLAAKAQKTESRFDDLLVPMIRKSLKIAVSVVGLVFLSDIFNWDITGLLTTLGIGGLAIGFAARETIANFFGSLTVLLDRPFHIGDWVKIGDVEGTIENVGFRTTRIRTFYNSLITVPNMQLTTSTIDNLGARRFRRIKAMLSLTYDTPAEKIDAFCEGIRELIRQHPYTRKDYYHVYFNEYADSSLNILLYCFHETPDWATELRERHRLFNDILRLAQRLGVSFAFPTQTIHLHQESESPDTAPPDISSDPQNAGRSIARDLVRQEGLVGHIPPPVDILADNAKLGGEADDDG